MQRQINGLVEGQLASGRSRGFEGSGAKPFTGGSEDRVIVPAFATGQDERQTRTHSNGDGVVRTTARWRTPTGSTPTTR